MMGISMDVAWEEARKIQGLTSRRSQSSWGECLETSDCGPAIIAIRAVQWGPDDSDVTRGFSDIAGKPSHVYWRLNLQEVWRQGRDKLVEVAAACTGSDSWCCQTSLLCSPCVSGPTSKSGNWMNLEFAAQWNSLSFMGLTLGHPKI